MSSRILTVMFTDIQGFTARTSATSREGLRTLLAVHEDLLLPVTAQFGGRLVKTIGDALLVTFVSPTNAVLCGLEMQRVLAGWNQQQTGSDRITIRVAISAGEVEERDKDVFGEAVNVAARVEGITDPGEVWFTESVYLAMNKAEVPSSAIGHRRLKGIPEPVKVYRAITDPHAADPDALTDALRGNGFDDVTLPTTGAPPRPRSSRAWLPWVAVGPILAAGVLALVMHFDKHEGAELPGEVMEGESGELVESGESGLKALPQQGGGGEVERLEAEIQEALDAGDLEVALERAFVLVSKHPQLDTGRHAVRAVVGEQTRKLVDSRAFDAALKRLDELEARWAWLTLTDLRVDVRLRQAEVLYDAMDHDGAYKLLDALLLEHPGDLRVARAMVERFGASYPNGARRLSATAAFSVAGHTEGRLDALTGDTLTIAYFRFPPYGGDAESAREILAARFPAAVDRAVEQLMDRSENTRVNAYHLARLADRITEAQILGYHFQNLTNLSSTSKGTLEAAMDWVEARVAAPGWDALKKEAKLPLTTPLRILGDLDERGEAMCALLARAFMPELTDPLLEIAMTSSGYRRRCNAYGILRDAGALDRLDLDGFHGWVLENFPTKTLHRCYDESVAWFAAAEGERVPAARAVLGTARLTAEKKLDAYRKAARPGWNSEFWPARAEKNLATVDAALAVPIP